MAADLPANPFERLHDILASIGEAGIGRRTEPGVLINNGQDTKLLAEGELIVDKIHGPDIVRPDHFLTISS